MRLLPILLISFLSFSINANETNDTLDGFDESQFEEGEFDERESDENVESKDPFEGDEFDDSEFDKELVVDGYTSWSKLGSSEVDYTPIMDNLGIEDLEILDPEDSKFKAFMDEVDKQRKASPINESLDNEPIKIVGFIAPLDFDDDGISRFLLVPYEGACIHVPAPPVNQTVLVNLKEPIPMDFYYEAIAVSGTIFVDSTDTKLAQSGYRIDADKVEVVPMETVFNYL